MPTAESARQRALVQRTLEAEAALQVTVHHAERLLDGLAMLVSDAERLAGSLAQVRARYAELTGAVTGRSAPRRNEQGAA